MAGTTTGMWCPRSRRISETRALPGHVGSAAAETLLGQGEDVTIVTRDSARAAVWHARGAQAVVLDIHDVSALRGLGIVATRILAGPPENLRTVAVEGPRRHIAGDVADVLRSDDRHHLHNGEYEQTAYHPLGATTLDASVEHSIRHGVDK